MQIVINHIILDLVKIISLILLLLMFNMCTYSWTVPLRHSTQKPETILNITHDTEDN